MECQIFLTLLFFSILSNANSLVEELTDDNIDSKMKGKNALVMFYSPSCGHCQRLKPTYEALSEAIESKVMISKIDCTEGGKKTCSKYSVNGFPTVKFISRVESVEVIEDYDGNRELNDLVSFVHENSRPAISELKKDDIAAFISSDTLPVIFGFFKDPKSNFLTKMFNLAPSFKKYYLIGYTLSQEAAKEHDQKIDTVVLYRQHKYKSPFEQPFIAIDSEKSFPMLLQNNKHSLVDIRTPKNEMEFSNPMISVFLPIDPHRSKAAFRRFRSIMAKAAQKVKDLTFTISTLEDYKTFVDDISAQRNENDIHLVAFDVNGNKFLAKETASIDDHKKFETILNDFIADFKKGNILEKFIKSQPVPTSDESNVKTVVAKNFDEIVFDKEKDVLIEFYAPWCGHCKSLAPIYEELATLLKSEKRLIIAKMDATANEVHKDFGVQGFPTIYLSKGGKKSSPILFNGKRDVSTSIFMWGIQSVIFLITAKFDFFNRLFGNLMKLEHY
ncbi:hypothetical protein HZS_2354 [Henneguya salminicola]|nr:hypothetical protein HZS_2354 [Henneguya salminicola]